MDIAHVLVGSRAVPLAEAAQLAPKLLTALEAMTAHYVALVNCGDCGRWDPETEDEVLVARDAIRKARGGRP